MSSFHLQLDNPASPIAHPLEADLQPLACIVTAPLQLAAAPAQTATAILAGNAPANGQFASLLEGWLSGQLTPGLIPKSAVPVATRTAKPLPATIAPGDHKPVAPSAESVGEPLTIAIALLPPSVQMLLAPSSAAVIANWPGNMGAPASAKENTRDDAAIARTDFAGPAAADSPIAADLFPASLPVRWAPPGVTPQATPAIARRQGGSKVEIAPAVGVDSLHPQRSSTAMGTIATEKASAPGTVAILQQFSPLDIRVSSAGLKVASPTAGIQAHDSTRNLATASPAAPSLATPEVLSPSLLASGFAKPDSTLKELVTKDLAPPEAAPGGTGPKAWSTPVTLRPGRIHATLNQLDVAARDVTVSGVGRPAQLQRGAPLPVVTWHEGASSDPVPPAQSNLLAEIVQRLLEIPAVGGSVTGVARTANANNVIGPGQPNTDLPNTDLPASRGDAATITTSAAPGAELTGTTPAPAAVSPAITALAAGDVDGAGPTTELQPIGNPAARVSRKAIDKDLTSRGSESKSFSNNGLPGKGRTLSEAAIISPSNGTKAPSVEAATAGVPTVKDAKRDLTGTATLALADEKVTMNPQTQIASPAVASTDTPLHVSRPAVVELPAADSSRSAPSSLPVPAKDPATGNSSAGTPDAPGLPPSGVQSARLLERAGQAEMHIGINTEGFGRVEVHTVLRDSQVGLTIGSERGELRSLVASDVASLQSGLHQQDIYLKDIRFIESSLGTGMNFTSGGGSADQQSPPHRSQAASLPTPEPKLTEPKGSELLSAVAGTTLNLHA